MNALLYICLSFLLFSCNAETKRNKGFQPDSHLRDIENYVYSSPSKAIDDLSKLDSSLFNRSDHSFKSLLFAIAYEQNYGRYSDKKSVSEAANWFRITGESYNLCRSLLYKSIANFTLNLFDSTAYRTLKESESIYLANNFNDLNLASKLYLYLGRLYSTKNELEKAEEAIRKSMDYSRLANNNSAFLNSALELFAIQTTLGRYSESIISLSGFGDIDSLPPYLEYNLYNALYNYHSSRRDSYIAIEYLRKILSIPSSTELSVNYAGTFFKIASLYKRTGLSDSALHYATMAATRSENNDDADKHKYYRLLADIHFEKGDYLNSSLMYQKAHKYYLDNETDKTRLRTLEIEKQFDLEQLEQRVTKLTQQKAIHLNMIFIIFVLLLFIVLYFVYKLRSCSDELHNVETILNETSKNKKSLWLISEIYKSSAYILPQLIDSVYLEAARSRRVSTETFDSLNKIIDIANSSSRSSLSSITNSDKFTELFGNIEGLNILTDFEKIIYILAQENLTNAEIANFLNSSQSSIRTMRGKIQKKIQNIDCDSNEE